LSLQLCLLLLRYNRKEAGPTATEGRVEKLVYGANDLTCPNGLIVDRRELRRRRSPLMFASWQVQYWWLRQLPQLPSSGGGQLPAVPQLDRQQHELGAVAHSDFAIDRLQVRVDRML
jgi:hypothetical protein